MIKIIYIFKGILFSSLFLVLASCSNTRESLNVGPAPPPDEFAVLTKAPLVIPPDFGLRPPNPGAPRPQGDTLIRGGQQILLQPGNEDSKSSTDKLTTDGEKALLSAAKIEKNNQSIRAIIALETQNISERGKSFAERVLSWQFPQGPDVSINANEEADRLKQQGINGLPISTLQPAAKRKSNILNFPRN